MLRPTRPRQLLAALIVSCCLCALGAGSAAADSLVYIKENNVWLANPDGSGAYQVTLDGTADNPYQSPSQADDGTIVAARKQPNGGPLYRLRQNGELLNTIPVGALIAGPFNPQVSPDGATVAFEQVFTRNVNGYFETSSDVRFTRTDGSTPNGLGEVGRGAGAPSWIDSGRAFVGINATATTVVPGQAPVEWWNDYDHQPKYFSFGQSVEDGEVAANGSIVVVRGEGSTATIQLYSPSGSFTEPPVPTCTLSEASPGPAGQEFRDPTFAPGGTALAWQEGNGVWAMGLPANCKEGKPQLQIPGASEPDWGPAPVNPGPRPPAPGTGPMLTAKAVKAPLAKTLAKGLKLRLRAPAAGLLRGTAKLQGTAKPKPVASGSRRVLDAGAATLVLRFSKAARRKLAGAKQARLRVTVSFRPAAGGEPQTVRLKVALKR